MNAAKNLLLALVVSLTGMSAGAKSLLKQVSKTTSQDFSKSGGNETNGKKGHGGSCD